jgi:hypothetical protein
MEPALRESAARLWRRILNADPAALFGREAVRLLNRNGRDRLPQPGYVGAGYQAGGLVFVSMNPGAGPQNGLSAEDLRQYRALETLRDATDGAASAAFDALTGVLAEVMVTWNIHRNFVVPVLKAAHTDFRQVAYLNLLKWRTAKSSGLHRLYQLGWDDHTCAQFELLAPGRVIAIGSDAGRAFARLHRAPVPLDSIPRAIGNNVGPEGRAALARIADTFAS